MATFPVPGGKYTDDWGAPRADTGSHKGNDIFAPKNTPIRAIEGGTISKIGWNSLGGWRLWINGKWYYAHLDHYAKGMKVGTVIREGQIIGYVGNTGDAKGTPFHLHLGYDPGGNHGSNWQNPFPLLQAMKMGTTYTPPAADSGATGTTTADTSQADSAELQRVQSIQASIESLPQGQNPPAPLQEEPQPLQTWRLLSTQPAVSTETQRLFGLAETAFGGRGA